jgi:hypothetical protein
VLRAAADVPWWGRALLGASAGSALGMIAGAIGSRATGEVLFLGLLPLVTAGNVALADLGRRAFAGPVVAASAVASLALGACFAHVGAALVAVFLGGLAAARLARAGRLRDRRRGILFTIGAAVCPLAAIAAFYSVKAAAPGSPLGAGLGAFEGLFWAPTGAAEAALAWYAARPPTRASYKL